MIKRRLFCLLLAIVTLLSGLNLAAHGTDDISHSIECIGLDAQSPFLGNGAAIDNVESAILYEANSDILMYAQNADAHIYPASLVKIMTALIAVEQGRLTDAIVVKEDILSTIPSSAVSVDLQVDELITLEDLLYCMMVASANDAAVVIADHISGSIDAFVSEMNIRASQIGCKDTAFINVHGIHDNGQYSTARDIAKILAVASENETFMKFFSATDYDVPATNKSAERFLSSTNYIINNDDVQIYYDNRATGSRTGTDKDGYRCLATTASSNGLKYVCIVTGSASTFEKDGYTVRSFGGYNETKQLLDMGFNGYHRGQVFFKGQSLKQQTVINGDNDVILGATSDVFTIVADNSALTYHYTNNQDFHAPITEGDILSTVEVWYNGMCIAETELYAMNSVNVAGENYSEISKSKPWHNILIYIIIAILGVIGAAVIGIFIYRRIWIARTAKSMRRKKEQ